MYRLKGLKVEELSERVTVDEIVDQLGISHASVHKIIHNDFQLKKVCSRWVIRELTTEHNKNRVELCSRLLELYQKEGEAFLKLL